MNHAIDITVAGNTRRTRSYPTLDEAKAALRRRKYDYKSEDGFFVQFGLGDMSCLITKPSENLQMTVQIVEVNS
jgi:hypothetical protein